MDLKSIQDHNKKKFGESLRDLAGVYLKSSWYFDKAWEKAIMIILSLCGVIRIIQWVT